MTNNKEKNKTLSKANFLKILFVLAGASILIGFATKSIDVAIVLFGVSFVLLNVIFSCYFKNKRVNEPKWFSKRTRSNKSRISTTNYATNPKYSNFSTNSYNRN